MDKETKEFCQKHGVVEKYQEGWAAQRDGKNIDDVGYAVGSNARTAWEIGYEDAENDVGI